MPVHNPMRNALIRICYFALLVMICGCKSDVQTSAAVKYDVNLPEEVKERTEPVEINQSSKGVEALVSGGHIMLPTCDSTVTKRLGVKPRIKRDKIHGQEYSWLLSNSLQVITNLSKDGSILWVGFSAKKVASGLPYHLIINQTMLDECKSTFAPDNPVETSAYAAGKEGAHCLNFKHGRYYLFLVFGDDLKLSTATISLIDHTKAD